MTFTKGLLLALLSALALDTGLAFARCVSRASLKSVCSKSTSCLFSFAPSSPACLLLLLLLVVHPGPLAGRAIYQLPPPPPQLPTTNDHRNTLLTPHLPSNFRGEPPPYARFPPLAAACKLLFFCGRSGRRNTRAGFVAPAPRLAFVPATSASLHSRARYEHERGEALARVVGGRGGCWGAAAVCMSHGIVVCSMFRA